MESAHLFRKRLSQKLRTEYLIFTLILVLAAALRCYRIAEPAWDGTHYSSSLRGVALDGWHGYCLCEWGRMARNYLKFGHLETKLGLMMYDGWIKPDFSSYLYRVDHPPLLPLLISISYRLFGIHEWNIRLVTLLTSLGLLPLVFWLGRKLGGKGVALTASLFFALLPVQAYYGALPVPHVLGSFFSWLTIVCYLKWVETRNTTWYAAIYLSFTLAALSDWPSYFVVPPLLLHYMVCEFKKTRSLRFVFSFGILPVVLLAVHFGWIYLLAGERGINKLIDRFLIRAISAGSEEGQYGFTMWDFYATAYARFKFFLTPTICTLSVVWLIDLIFAQGKLHRRTPPEGPIPHLMDEKENHRGIPPTPPTLLRKPKGLTSQNMIIAALFLFGLGQNLALSNMVYIHDFDMVFDFSLLFAILAALGTRFVAKKVLLNKRVLTIPFHLIVCYLLATQSAVALRRLHSVYIDADRFLIGSKVNEITNRNAIVMGDFRPDYYMGFYADRPWPLVSNLQDLTGRMQTDSSYSYYILRDGESVDGELREYLVRNHPVETSYGYSFFNLREAGSNTIHQNPQIEHSAEAHFEDKLMFLGYNVEEVIQKKREPSWLDKYFNAHAELMPEYRTTFRITYFWQCLEEMEKDYVLGTQFEGHHGQTYRIDQSHQGVNGAYPTSMWQVGEVIREEYQVEIPADYPPIRYTLWVGVRDGEERLELVSDVETDEEDRIRLGEIEVLPAAEPTPLTAEPHPQNRIEANINDEFMFLGYDLNDRNPEPGDQLRVATYWQSLRKTEQDYAVQVELRNGGYKVREVLDIAPTRLWEEGRYYQGDAVLAINPHLLEGTYSLNLGLERDDGTDTQVNLASLDIPDQRRHILKRTRKANYGESSEIIRPDESLSLPFHLKEREPLELVAGWTGKAEGEQTRVEVYITNAYWREKYLGTWVVKSGDYRVTKWKIGKLFTAIGENAIELRVPEVRERVYNVGWRGAVERVFPDLLQDPRTDYDGPIQMDFAQASTRWEGNWDDYYDLAQVYAERGMDGEVARLYEEAVDKGVGPRRVDDFSLFKRAYKALGEEGKTREIEERIGERIAYKIGANLGGKVEFLGYSLEEKGNGHRLSLFFRCLEDMKEDYTLWVHGEVEDESLLAGVRSERGYAVFDHLLPTSRWEVGEVYQDDEVRGLRTGRYHFTLGLWRPEDGSRLWREDDPNAHIIDLGWIEIR